MKESEADIFRSESLGNNTSLIELTAKEIAGSVQPGQFVQVRTGTGTDPFLRRTVSVCGADRKAGRIQLLVEIVGPGTEYLSLKRCGASLNIIGPLGNGFDPVPAKNGPVWLIAGGIGAAPLIFLANELQRRRMDMVFFMGARTGKALFGIERFLHGDTAVETSTEDGSSGYHGLITELVQERIPAETPSILYTCGPNAMMRNVAEIAASSGCPVQVSLEERMACGMGACYGCSVELKDGSMARVCHDGPVFDSGVIAWE